MSNPESLRVPPPDARVVVEGGHHTVRWSSLSISVLTGPQVYFFEVLVSTPPPPYQIDRRPVDDDPAREWVIVDVPAGVEVPLPSALPSRWVLALQPPTESELQSLRSAVEAARKLAGEIAHVTVALLIGDLYLPIALRKDIGWAMPAAYKPIIETLERIPYLLLRESACQNLGETHVIKKAKRTLARSAELASLYETRGFTILREGAKDSNTVYLAADALLDEPISGYPVVALTKGGNKPACATTMAGKMLDFIRRRFTHMVVWYDVSDDAEIRKKNIEGTIITSCFTRRGDIDVQVVTMDHGELLRIDALDTASLRRPGVRSGHEQLATETNREARHLGLSLIAARASDECCIYPRDDVRAGEPS